LTNLGLSENDMEGEVRQQCVIEFLKRNGIE